MNKTYKQQQARRYLQAVNGIRNHLASLKELKPQTWRIATNVTAKPTKAAAELGTTIDRSNNITRPAEIWATTTEEIKAVETELLIAVRERLIVIHRLNDHNLQAILIYHYINDFTWEATAAAVGYSLVYTQQLAAKALTQLYDVMPEKSNII